MNSRNFILKLVVFSIIPFGLLSCGSQSAQESAIAKQITFNTSNLALVLPNKLSALLGQTCNSSDVSGPRVRLKASISWAGTGKLLPLVIRLIINDEPRVAGDFAGSLSSSADNQESLARIFGVTTDYIPSGTTVYSTSTCFLDYGGLPKTITDIKGANQVDVPATLSITGVVRDDDGNDVPFTKEVTTIVTYVAGSVP